MHALTPTPPPPHSNQSSFLSVPLLFFPTSGGGAKVTPFPVTELGDGGKCAYALDGFRGGGGVFPRLADVAYGGPTVAVAAAECAGANAGGLIPRPTPGGNTPGELGPSN